MVTELRVVDSFPTPDPRELLVAVEVLAGMPALGMTFAIQGETGRWQFATPVHYIPETVGQGPPRRPVCLRALDGNIAGIREGIILVEVS